MIMLRKALIVLAAAASIGLLAPGMAQARGGMGGHGGMGGGMGGPSYRQFLVTAGRSGGGGFGLTVGRLGDDLDPIVECHTENEFWQLVVAIEPTPAFLRGLKQFEDHRECRLVGQAALRSDGAVAHGGEGAFDGVGRPQVFPVLGREVVERQ
jgi:hypothetical protein